jgi:hypothetical protein
MAIFFFFGFLSCSASSVTPRPFSCSLYSVHENLKKCTKMAVGFPELLLHLDLLNDLLSNLCRYGVVAADLLI